MDSSQIRVKIDGNKQKEIFTQLIRKFNKDSSKTAEYLGISKTTLNYYKNNKIKSIPEDVITKAINLLEIKMPKILYKTSLNKIRKENIKKMKFILEKRYGDNWRKILSKKGVLALQKKYSNNWDNLRKGRCKLKEKYGKDWQKELSKLAKIALKNKYGENYKNRPSNAHFLLENRKLNYTEKRIVDLLKKEKIRYETHVMKNGLEYDIVIPDKEKPKYVLEISNSKPTTYNQRYKILQLFYQKKNFPNAYHIVILKTKYLDNKNNYQLHKITKQFFDRNNITLLSLENINKNFSKVMEDIKLNKKISVNESFLFGKKLIVNSKKGCITQSKKQNFDEKYLHNLLLNINSEAYGPKILKIIDESYICVDNFEIYKNQKIAYEITKTNDMGAIRKLAGKILLYKTFNKNLKFIVILKNDRIFHNSSLKFLKEISDAVILKKDYNEKNLLKIRNSLTSPIF